MSATSAVREKILSREEVEGIVQRLCDGIAPLFPHDRMEAILFGSYARGDAEEDSDIDVMILLDASREEIAARNWETCDIAADLSIDYDVIFPALGKEFTLFPQCGTRGGNALWMSRIGSLSHSTVSAVRKKC